MNKKTRIACCGDSITFGALATSAQNSYPAVLQVMLGDDFSVENYGKCCATVISNYEEVPGRYLPYIKSAEYKSSLCSEPDIIILMLGMNDANPTHHFNSENGGPISNSYLKLYRQTLEDIIEKYKALPASPCVYLAKTTEMKRVACEVFSQKYVDDFTNNLVKIRKIQEEVARDKKLILIDTLSEMQEETYYSDGCHLTDVGYFKLASIVKKVIYDK